METTSGGDEYVVSGPSTSSFPCEPAHAPNPHVVSECGLSELPSSIHSDDESHHDAFFVQTCLEVDYSDRNAETSEKPLFSMRKEDSSEVNLDPRAKQKEYLNSKRRVVAERLSYARPTRSSWPLKQGAMGDLPQLKKGP